MKKVVTFMLTLLIAVAMLLCMSGCSERRYENYEYSAARDAKVDVKIAANNFEVMRRLTVVNTRTDAIILQVEGLFSMSNNDFNEMEITIQMEDGSYRIDYIYLGENVMYVIEDITEPTIETGTVHFFGSGFDGGRE